MGWCQGGIYRYMAVLWQSMGRVVHDPCVTTKCLTHDLQNIRVTKTMIHHIGIPLASCDLIRCFLFNYELRTPQFPKKEPNHLEHPRSSSVQRYALDSETAPGLPLSGCPRSDGFGSGTWVSGRLEEPASAALGSRNPAR